MRGVDRAILRNVVIVAVASTAGLVVVGTTCLGRNMARLDATSGLDRDASRTSAGGVPVGSATIAAGTIHHLTPTPLPRTATPPRPQASTVGSFNVPPRPPPGLRGLGGQVPTPLTTPVPLGAAPASTARSASSDAAPPPSATAGSSVPPGIVVHPTSSSAPTFAPPPGFTPPHGAEAPR
jgi:hypothetical protein